MKNLKRGFTIIELLVIIAIIVVLAIIVGSQTNAGWFNSKPNASNENTFMREAALTELNQRKLINAVSVPKLETSQERKNLVRLLERFNTEDKISYIYLINYGKVMAFYVIKGKVSSVNSLLTNPEQIIDDYGKQCDRSSPGNGNCYIVSSPDIDGSYGTNGDAIFFFTTDDVYVEWRGDYMLADQALKLTQQPELIREIK